MWIQRALLPYRINDLDFWCLCFVYVLSAVARNTFIQRQEAQQAVAARPAAAVKPAPALLQQPADVLLWPSADAGLSEEWIGDVDGHAAPARCHSPEGRVSTDVRRRRLRRRRTSASLRHGLTTVNERLQLQLDVRSASRRQKLIIITVFFFFFCFSGKHH